MNEYRVYAACLASYNNGVLHGRWIDCGLGADHIREEIADMLRESKFPNVTVTCPECDGEGTSIVIADSGSTGGGSGYVDGPCPTCNGEGTVPSAEECAFHDFEGFPASLCNEYESVDKLAAFAEAADALHDEAEREAFACWYEDRGDGVPGDELLDRFRDDYDGTYAGEVDWAAQYIFETGLLADVPDNIARYFDYEAFARDAFFELTGIEGNHGLHVFRN